MIVLTVALTKEEPVSMEENTNTPRNKRRTRCTTRLSPSFHETLAVKPPVRSLLRVASALLVCLVSTSGCANEPVQVGSPRIVPDAEIVNAEWGEPDYSNGYSETAGGRHLLIKMKLKGPYKGSMLSITTTSLSDNAQKWRDENLKRLENPHVSANWKHIVAFKSPRGVGNRSAYGYSYYESDFRRWAQAWFVNCMDGYVCEVHLESPIDSGSFESKLSNILNEIKWKKRTVYG